MIRRISRSTSCLVLLGLASSIAATASAKTYQLPASEKKYEASAATSTTGLGADCQVSIQVSLPRSAVVGGAGQPAPTDENSVWHSVKHCLKTKDKPLQPMEPGSFYVAGSDDLNNGVYPLRGVCADGLPDETCLWNGVFRHAAPPNFTIAVENNAGSLGNFLSLVRVFRNGELAFSWRPGTTNETRLVVPGVELKGYLEPFLAPIDLRVLPAGAEVPTDVLSAKVATAQSPWVSRFETAWTALKDDPAFNAADEDYQCLVWLTKKAVRDAKLLSGQLVPDVVEQAPPHCTDPVGPIDYSKVREALIGVAQDTNDAIASQIKALSLRYGTAIADAALKVKTKVIASATGATLANGKTVGQTIVMVDELASSSTDAFNQAYQLVDKVRSESLALAADRERQAQDFAHVAAALEASGSVFQPVRTNPSLATGEVALTMKYRDPLQGFGLAVWHAITVRMAGNQGINDLSLANAIPAIDLVGFRYNWGSGYRNFRMGLGALYFKDTVTETAATSMSTTQDVFHVAAELNAGVGAANAGFGIVMDGGSQQYPQFKDRFRLLVGVDLFKVFTGQPGEAL